MGMLDAFKPLIEYEAGRTVVEGLRKLREKIDDDDD